MRNPLPFVARSCPSKVTRALIANVASFLRLDTLADASVPASPRVLPKKGLDDESAVRAAIVAGFIGAAISIALGVLTYATIKLLKKRSQATLAFVRSSVPDAGQAGMTG